MSSIKTWVLAESDDEMSLVNCESMVVLINGKTTRSYNDSKNVNNNNQKDFENLELCRMYEGDL